MKFKNQVVLQLTISFILGIVFGQYTEFSLWHIKLFLLVVFLFMLLSVTIPFNNLKSVLLLFFTFILGSYTILSHKTENQNTHYSHYLKTSEKQTLVFRLLTPLKPNKNYYKYIISAQKINGTLTQGKLLLYLDKKNNTPIKPNALYLLYGELNPITGNKNPFEFNYKTYLKTKHIDYAAYSNSIQLIQIKSLNPSFQSNIRAFKKRLKKKLHHAFPNPNTHAVLDALLLGDKQAMNANLYQNYARSGGIHFLAVSGLHVGIVLLILSAFLRPLLLLKKGEIIRLVLLVFLIWCFAMFTGFSSSVVRAVTMYTLYVITTLCNRKQHLLDLVFVSIFVLLVWNPNYLFDMGFQLSYGAVLGIIIIHPLISKIHHPKHFITKFLWNTLSVSLSAQLGVLPLSLYYFHYFPTLFLVTNVLVLPVIGFILFLGIIVIVMFSIDLEFDVIVLTLNKLINLLNTIVTWIAQQETFIFSEIPFNLLLACTTYLFLFCCIQFLYNRNIFDCYAMLLALFFVQGAYLYSLHESSVNKLIVFYKSKTSIIGVQHGRELTLYSDTIKTNDNPIAAYISGHFIAKTNHKKLKNLLVFDQKKVLIVDQLGVYKPIPFSVDYVVLTQSPKINLERLIEELHPKLIIADGSNYKTMVLRWEATCKKKKLPFHNVYEKGAFILYNERLNVYPR